MESQPKDAIECTEITGDDVEAALRDLGTYIDISPEDLRALCASALTHARQRVAQSEPVRGLMTTRIISVKKDADIHEVSRLLSENRVSGLPVLDDDARVVGVITEKDVLAMTGIDRGHTMKELIRHLLGEPLPRRHGGRLVEDYMSTPAITVQPDTDIRQAAAIMNERGIKRLIVVDSNGALVGIIARADIVRAVGGK
jgi:CBS domain-containing membrane protein